MTERVDTSDLLICNTCGTQYSTSSRAELKSCRICDDPRQYVPRTGQSFTTLKDLRSSSKYHNEFTKLVDGNERFWSVRTEPAFAIAQRAILIHTPQGNVLWDCLTYIDDETVTYIKSLGGLSAIVISHPHYYSTHLEWSAEFDCPVYLSYEDKEWLNRSDTEAQSFISNQRMSLKIKNRETDIKILKLGGHFPGSLVLVAYERLLIADTIMTVPAGLGDWSIMPSPDMIATTDQSTPIPFPSTIDNPSNVTTIRHRLGERPLGLNSFSFMWSIPNQIPLNPSEIATMWEVLSESVFRSTHGAFQGMDVFDAYGGSDRSVKGRILDSMQIQVRRMGWREHPFLSLRL